MTARQNHDVLLLGAAGGAAFLGYEFLYKPWKAKHDAALLTGGAGSLTSPGLPPFTVGSLVSSPPPVVNPGGVQGSIVDARVTPGGDVGMAMWRKNWTQPVATARLTALKEAIANAKSAIAALKANTVNPNAAGVAAARVQLGVYANAIASAQAAKAAALTRGDTQTAQQYDNWLVAAAQDVNEINNRIAQASQPLDNSGDIAKWQGALAGHIADYFALTGVTLS